MNREAIMRQVREQNRLKARSIPGLYRVVGPRINREASLGDCLRLARFWAGRGDSADGIWILSPSGRVVWRIGKVW